MELINWADFCSGIGAGFPYAGCRVPGLNLVVTCDTDSYCRDILLSRYKRAACIRDIRAWRAVRQEFGTIDLFTASPPCTPFSIQGKRKGASDERDCIPALLEAIALSTPRFWCIENVPGLLSCPLRPGAGVGTYFTFILSEMELFGYDVEWLCVESSHFAAPWRRKRLLMVGFARGIIPQQPRPWIEQVREYLSCERDSWEGRGIQPGLAGVEERTPSGVLVPIGVKSGDSVTRRRRGALGNALDPRVANIALRRILYLNSLL
ncbi:MULTISPECIES: DNA cytosine methyltransferase [unclassified Coleofasciculus]|uniref:DNA cytosine methyltransferase n=1 Tax=unclassified Coleofasciculus TaxID=2692782 RepID=UPI00187E4165|nr:MULTISPECIES: DNA cytosine methyltransferase [unclassified Coleofasciculus]MBE9130120.1 DNA cytosine methyltransferase [Coleofasciculus sp. LEGE 07081]MBE9152463.1 DNA cytosine methyltransferase [Coleofasciculus sp. LEGE 07092]